MILLAISGLLVIVITALLGMLLVPGDAGKLPGGAMSASIVRLLHLDQQSWGSTGTTLALLVVLLMIQGFFSFFRVYIFSYVTEHAMKALRRDTYEMLIKMPMQFFNERRLGELSSRISADISTIQETLNTTLAEVLRQLIITVVGIAWLVSYSYKLTLVMLGSLPVIIVVMVVFGRYIRKLGKKTQDRVAESSIIVSETLTGIVNVKSFANERHEALRYGNAIEAIRQLAMKSAVWRGMFGTFIIIFLFGALGLVMGVGSHLQKTGELSVDVLPVFIMLTGLVAGSIGGLAAQMGILQKSIGTTESVMEILSYIPEAVSVDEVKTDHPIHGNVSFRNVHFSYASRPDIEVLKGISFELKAGEQIALVGSSGSGKSTIASLVQQFYQPNSGEILFDGTSGSTIGLTPLRSQMALVPQEVILFGGSIRENIAYGKPKATEEEIIEAAKRANAWDFISSFPENLNTIVGERGIQLSGGQRQRIAIARAVLRNPTILILDEATSSLDSESEKLVQEALENLMRGRTSLVIAHRLSTIRNASKILVLDQGKISEYGTHTELMSKENGQYRRLVEMQYESDPQIG